jgi:hypothetical protein
LLCVKENCGAGGRDIQTEKKSGILSYFFFKREIKQNPPFLLHLLFGVGSADDSTKAKGGTP